MIIAREKRRSNIAEFILYMWQVEDLIRAYGFNIDLIEKNIISQFEQPRNVKEEIKDWYANLIVMMHEEGIRKKGHLSLVEKIVARMNKLHAKILSENDDTKYIEQYTWAKPNIEELKKKLPGKNISDIETCLDGLYGLLLMRLRKKSISKETEHAMTTFSNLLAILALRFKQVEKGEMEIN
jgi:hypothetical protein